MKSILDPSFQYYDSSNTDLRRTFARIKAEQEALQRTIDSSSMYDREPKPRWSVDEELDDPRHGQAASLNARR